VLPFAPAGVDHNPNQHSEDEVLTALRGRHGTRRFSFRYDVLTYGLVKLADWTSVISASVEQNWLADIKRKARFTVRDTGDVNYLDSLIKPWARLHLPPYGDDDWVEWSQGVFVPSTPQRHADPAGLVTRDVDGFDLLQVLVDDCVSTRYSVSASTAYTSAVATVLASAGLAGNIHASTSVLPVAMEWDPGTPKLRVINDLLSAINYQSLSFDEDGRAVVAEYVSPAARAEGYTYADDTDGLIIPEVDQELDLFSVANQWTLVVSEPDRDAIYASYSNTDPSSPTSIPRRGRTITDFRTEQQAVDIVALYAKVARLAFEASQIYEAIDIQTALMPVHSGNDVLRLRYGPLGIDDKYSEQSWSMGLRAGAPMKHRVRRVVSV